MTNKTVIRASRKSRTWQTLHSSAHDAWETPPAVFAELAREFSGFTLDAAAAPHNALCRRYITREQNALEQDWLALATAGGRPATVWLNPPYGRGLDRWVAKAGAEAARGCTVVCLLPASTSTRWFHDGVLASGAEVRFHRGRLKFLRGGAPGASAPMDTMTVIFRPARAARRRAA